MGPDDWYRNGDQSRRAVARQNAQPVLGPTLLARFWKKVNKGEGCWEWTAARSADGYGVIGAGGRGGPLLRAHRVSYEIHNGPVPIGMYVCHHCDNPPCVRPDHLYAGTNQQNQLDAVKRGRIKTVRPDDVRDAVAKRAPSKRGPGRPRVASSTDADPLTLATLPAAGEALVRHGTSVSDLRGASSPATGAPLGTSRNIPRAAKALDADAGGSGMGSGPASGAPLPSERARPESPVPENAALRRVRVSTDAHPPGSAAPHRATSRDNTLGL